MKYIILSIAIWIIQLTCYSQGTVSITISPNNPTINDDIYLKTDVFFLTVGSYVTHQVLWQGNDMFVDLYYTQGGQQMPSTIIDSVQIGLLNVGTYSVIARLMVKNQSGSDNDLQNYGFRDSDTIVFRVEEELSLFNEHIDDIVMNIFPNPATNLLNFTLNETPNSLKLEIFDISGKKVKIKNLQNNSNKEFNGSVDISGLKNGLYFCKFTSGEKVAIRKFLKQ